MFDQKEPTVQKLPTIPILTIDTFPGKDYTILSFVYVEEKLTNFQFIGRTLFKHAEQASTINASAIIGLCINEVNGDRTVTYGTAIQFI